MIVVPLFEARGNLPRFVSRAESGEIIQVTRHGKPAAIMMGQNLYERLLSSSGGIVARLEAWALLCAESGNGDGIGTAFERLRSTDPGRAVNLD